MWLRLQIPSVVAALILCASGCSRGHAAPPPAATPHLLDYRSGLGALDGASTLDGEPLSRRAEARGTVVLFFASWCGPCRHELALLSQLRTEYPELEIIGVNIYEDFRDRSDRERLDGFLAESAPWLQVAAGSKAIARQFGGVPKIPSMFVYDARGNGVAEFRAMVQPRPDRADLESAIRRAVGRPAQVAR